MKPTTGSLNTLLLGGGQFLMADLYTITLSGGGKLYWTSADVPLSWGGNTFTPANDNGTQPILKRGTIRTMRGLEVQTCDLTLFCGTTALLGGLNAKFQCINGYLDKATILVQRAFLSTWSSVVGAPCLFLGTVASVDVGSMQVVLHVKSVLELLNLQQMPHVLLQPTCANLIYDAGCGVSKAAYTVTGVVTATVVPIANQFSIGNPQTAGYYVGGVITFTSGANAGLSRAVQAYAGSGTGLITTSLPFPNVPSYGDAYSIYPGCSRNPSPPGNGQLGCLNFGVTTGPNFVIGQQYQILTTGGTSFTTIGATANTVGVVFIATGVGTGITGTASGNSPRFRGCPAIPPPATAL